ncbi:MULTISPECIES: hypothetical protein [Nocardia]|uniref:hypothetical protein n=1 Tax=Nocardia TaxID=1817 RepID=UPI000D68F880|nr:MULTISPECIES: hypothetical protein [Nocardia]
MPGCPNLADIRLHTRDIEDHHVILSTDGQRVRIVIRDTEHPDTDGCYTDLGPVTATTLAAVINLRHIPMQWATASAGDR